MNVVVTGSAGFLGRNLVVALLRAGRHDWRVVELGRESTEGDLDSALRAADVIFHLAGVNRPQHAEEFLSVNLKLTRAICERLVALGRSPTLVLASSAQAAEDTEYGRSKLGAEQVVKAFASKTGASIYVFRLPGVFGKWCQPNYNSVVATFCHNIARDLPITISDPARSLRLVYIDDVVASFARILDGVSPSQRDGYSVVEPEYRITLGALADTLRSFRASRVDLRLPDMADPLVRALYGTYVSYLPEDQFAYELTQRTDARGELAEVLKSEHIGQFFISRTRPGSTRGDHYHDTKVEKFVVVDGDAMIRFRRILGDEVIDYQVSGHEFKVVDIPTGYTHSIENVGERDLIVLFWSDEIFDRQRPDTFFELVQTG